MVELIIQPVITFLVLLQVVAGTKDEYKSVKRFLDVLIAIIGFFLMGRALYLMIITWEQFATPQNLMSFLLPIIMTITFLPFVYLLAVYANYDKLLDSKHGRLAWAIIPNDKPLRKYAYWKILQECNLNLGRWWKFDPNYANKLFNIQNRTEVDEVMNSFRKSLSKD
jgi:hypothetical protein